MPVKKAPIIALAPNQPKRPWLLVNFINPHTNNSQWTWALVDTGADDCALPASFAPLLGHNLQAGVTSQSGTGNGITTVYNHTTRIEIPGFSTKDTLIAFMPNLQVPLLGVKSFLSHFKLTVDYPCGYFSLRKP